MTTLCPLRPLTFFVPPRFQPISPKRTNFSSKPKPLLPRCVVGTGSFSIPRLENDPRSLAISANLFYQSTPPCNTNFERAGKRKKAGSIEKQEENLLFLPTSLLLVTTLLDSFLEMNSFETSRRPFLQSGQRGNCRATVQRFPIKDRKLLFPREERCSVKNVRSTRRGKILNFVLHSRESLTRWNDALERENFQRDGRSGVFAKWIPPRANKYGSPRRNPFVLRDEIHKEKKKRKHPLPFDYPFGYTRRASLVSALFARCSSRVRSYRDDGRDEEGGGREWRREWINPCNGAKRT